MPYRKTWEALTNEDHEEYTEKIKDLLGNFAKVSLESAYHRFEHIESKHDKKIIMKQHVYLDCLVTLNRLPNQISKPLSELQSAVFKDLPIEPLRAIFEQFTDLQTIDQKDISRMKDLNQASINQIKFVKTKSHQQKLVCSIIAISLHIAQNQRIKGSVLARALKKDLTELKNYFKEIGLHIESCENTKEGNADVLVYLNTPKLTKKEEALTGYSKRYRAKSDENIKQTTVRSTQLN